VTVYIVDRYIARLMYLKKCI